MSLEEIRNLCLSFPGTEEGLPFGPETLVFKVKGKIFLLLSLDADPIRFNVKCDPLLALEYREQFKEVLPGYHMNKTHWNTIIVNGTLSRSLLNEMIQHSFSLVSGNSSAKRRNGAVKKGGGKAKKH